MGCYVRAAKRFSKIHAFPPRHYFSSATVFIVNDKLLGRVSIAGLQLPSVRPTEPACPVVTV